MSNNSLAAKVNALKKLTAEVKANLNKVNAAPTPAAANPPLQSAAAGVNQMNRLAVGITNRAPGTRPANNAANAVLNAGNGIATAAQGVATMAVANATANPTPTNTIAAGRAVTAATSSANAAVAGNPPAAANAAAATGNAAKAAANGASPRAKEVANSLKKQLLKVSNTNNKPNKAFSILKSSFVTNAGYFLNNEAYKQENVNRAYTNLMKNGGLSNAQKNVLKRVYFAYKNRPQQIPSKNRPKIMTNLAGVNTYQAYLNKKAANAAAKPNVNELR